MKKYFSMMLALTVITCTLGACGSGKKSDLEKVTLSEVAHSIFYAPLYLAIEQGYFAEEGIDLELVTSFGADKVTSAVLSKEADIAFMGPESTVYIYSQNADDHLVNFAQLTQRAGNFLVARTKLEDFQWTDLKGHYVLGGRKGGMPQMVFEYVLKKNGIDPAKDLTINQNIDFGSTAAAFAGNQGDFTVEFEPSATALEMEQKGYVIASLGEASGYVPYTAFSAKKSYLESHPQLIQSFTNALQKGMDDANQLSPEEIANIIQPQFPETDAKQLTAIIARYQNQDTWKENLIFEESAFILLQDILTEAGELEKRVPYDALVDTSFATKASN